MDENFQNKLLKYAPEPPERVWEAVVAVLDEGGADFSKRLYVYEETPPAITWNNIEDTLQGKLNPTSVPFLRKYKKLISYSAAAIVLLAVAIFALQGTGNNRVDPVRSIVSETTKEVNNNNNEVVQNDVTPGEGYTYTTAKSVNTHNKTNFAVGRSVIPNRFRPRLNLGAIAISESFLPRVASTKRTVSNSAPIEKYMVYSDEEGNAIKLSKKLFDMINCVREDIICKQRIQQLQQQFASTAVTTDFTGALEILKNLKENQ